MAPARSDTAPPLLAAQPVRRRTLPLDITHQLLDLIASSRGAEVTLPAERALSEQLRVSRNALREALAALEGLGVIELRGRVRVGIASRARTQLVARLPAADPESALAVDPVEVRQVLEPAAAALAAERADRAAVAEMERWVTLMAEGDRRGERIVDYDAGFHVSVARATRNRTMVEMIAALNSAVSASRERSFEPAGAGERAIAAHREILAAIAAGSAEDARDAMRRHLDDVEQLVRASLGEGA